METTTAATFAERRKATIIWLRDKFPHTFTVPPRPLEIGIHEAIFTQINDIDAPSRRTLRRTLQCYVNSPFYLRALTADAWRIDLEGNPSSQVTEHDYAIAQGLLAKQRQHNSHYRKINALKRQQLPEEAPDPVEETKGQSPLLRKTLTLKKSKQAITNA